MSPPATLYSVGSQSVTCIKSMLTRPFWASKGLCTNPAPRTPPIETIDDLQSIYTQTTKMHNTSTVCMYHKRVTLYPRRVTCIKFFLSTSSLNQTLRSRKSRKLSPTKAALDCWTNSPCQYAKEYKEDCMENIQLLMLGCKGSKDASTHLPTTSILRPSGENYKPCSYRNHLQDHHCLSRRRSLNCCTNHSLWVHQQAAIEIFIKLIRDLL